MSESLVDGFGNEWLKCWRADCGLHIVRPGKVQCDLCAHASQRPIPKSRAELEAENERLHEALHWMCDKFGAQMEDGPYHPPPDHIEPLIRAALAKEPTT